ncbi:MAG TPA: TetR/AcrR family transcriptional regulator [Lapillicoccus sp.]|nr:TetR/AcrR family transcriptional regulator [Lapillicoccus sp.]
MTTGALAGPAAPTVERLLDAAAGAFADRGFHATTTRDIASRAGLSAAGVYVHFDSKEALLYALSRRGHEAALELVRASARPPGTATQRVARVMSRFATWHAEHHEVARVVQYEFRHLLPAHRDEVLALRKDIDRAVRALLEEGVAAGEFEVADVSDTALALMSLCIDVARWYSPGVHRTPTGIGRTYASLGVRLLGAHA